LDFVKFESFSERGVRDTPAIPKKVPEPGTLSFFGIALVGLAFIRRRAATT
jgi:hypothetical protein